MLKVISNDILKHKRIKYMSEQGNGELSICCDLSGKNFKAKLRIPGYEIAPVYFAFPYNEEGCPFSVTKIVPTVENEFDPNEISKDERLMTFLKDCADKIADFIHIMNDMVMLDAGNIQKLVGVLSPENAIDVPELLGFVIEDLENYEEMRDITNLYRKIVIGEKEVPA